MPTRLLPIEQNTSLATFAVEINGEMLPHHIPVYSIEVLREVNRIPTATLYLADGDASTGQWRLSSEEFFVPGNEIRIFAGYHSENEVIFSGVVVRQSLRVRERRLELQVMCKHHIVALASTKKSRHFIDMTDSDAVAEILAEYDIPEGVIDATETTHTDLVQYDCFDWDFIMMRMEANGRICMVDEEGFHAVEPSVDGDPVATLQFGANIQEFDATIDGRRQYEAISAQGWNPATQAEEITDAADPEWTTPGNLTPSGLAAAAGGVHGTLRHGGSPDPAELQSWSDATLLRSRMSLLRGRARVQGLSVAKPGAVMELAGFGDRFNGPVWTGAVRHEIGHGNWLTDIEFGLPEEEHARRFIPSSLPAAGLISAVSGLCTGVVTSLEGDPAGEARIRIRIPGMNFNGDGIWARVATLDAGNERGTFFLPEIGDEVVAGFLNDDPRFPVVLGMLHSSAHPSPEEASDDNHSKGYVSRSGMQLRFDDEKTILRIETPQGNKILLDDDAGTTTLSDSNGNKIVLSSSGITIKSAGDLMLQASGSVKAEGQTNIEMKASAQWKAEGSAGAEINSSGITVVKGSLVQIN